MRDAALARPHQGCAVASLIWASGDALYVTIVVKATLSLRDGGPSALVTAAPVEIVDRYVTLGGDRQALAVARELFPYRPRVDVTLSGHAQLPPAGVGVARLVVRGEGGWIDKSLEVRSPPTGGYAGMAPSQVALGWEATWADDENPIGVQRGSLAWILDPEQPGRGVGFGPVAPHWPRRARALGHHDPSLLEIDAPRIPEAFDWEHFQAAPADQQLAWIAGSEAIELHGVIDRVPSFHTSLPHLVAAAWAFAPWEVPEGQPIDLVADGLTIDADRQLAHVTWRATYPMLGADWSLSQLQLMASVEARVAPAPMVRPVTPAALRRTPATTLQGLGGKPRPPPVPVAVTVSASLFDTDDGEDMGTRPLTRKELLAAMAASGKALPFGPKRMEHAKTSEIEVPTPSVAAPSPSPLPSAARPSEQTRPIALDQIFGADGDHGTVAGDEDDLAGLASLRLPAFLRQEGPRSGRPQLDTDLDSPSLIASRAPVHVPDPDPEPSFGDEETHVEDEPSGR